MTFITVCEKFHFLLIILFFSQSRWDFYLMREPQSNAFFLKKKKKVAPNSLHSAMNEILLQKLNEYEKIFTLASYEKHIVIILTIKNFVQRFQKFPELKCRANLMVSSDEVFFLTVGLCSFQCFPRRF